VLDSQSIVIGYIVLAAEQKVMSEETIRGQKIAECPVDVGRRNRKSNLKKPHDFKTYWNVNVVERFHLKTLDHSRLHPQDKYFFLILAFQSCQVPALAFDGSWQRLVKEPLPQ